MRMAALVGSCSRFDIVGSVREKRYILSGDLVGTTQPRGNRFELLLIWKFTLTTFSTFFDVFLSNFHRL